MIKFNQIILLLCILFTASTMSAQYDKYGIVGEVAPDWQIADWIDETGESAAYELADFEGKVIYMLAFQSWCPGCHKVGFPNLLETMSAFEGNEEVAFVSVQTVFEGESVNTLEKVKATQEEYDLKIPFGHDAGDDSYYMHSQILTDYKTGGTPWVIIIDKEKKVAFNNFHLPSEKAVEIIAELIEKE